VKNSSGGILKLIRQSHAVALSN